MPYDGRYGKVAKAMRRKMAVKKFGSPDNSRRRNKKFSDGGGSQKLPDNKGVPPYVHGDNTSGVPQDEKAKRMRPSSMQMKAPSMPKRNAYAATGGGSRGEPSPKLPPQDGRNPAKKDSRGSAKGFRSFKSIVRGNVMGRRPPKKLAPQSK